MLQGVIGCRIPRVYTFAVKVWDELGLGLLA